MIPRTVFSGVLESVKSKPVTLITGARQTGKTTLCRRLSEELGMKYVSLASVYERNAARSDPSAFLKVHGFPLIIDEVQYAPELFDHIEEVVDREAFDNDNRAGLYVLTGSQAFNLMQGVTQSMAGRVGIVKMNTLSLNEIIGRREEPFSVDYEYNYVRSQEKVYTQQDVLERIVRGGYPELYRNPELRSDRFFDDYITTYLERDVRQLINVRDESKFLEFLNIMGSLSGQEFVYETVAKAIEVDKKTVKSWTSILESCGIIHFLQPYYDRSVLKRVVSHPKMYFWDTGLACFLARVVDGPSLGAMYLKGPMIETLMVNEIMKSYMNTGESAGFYYYRDSGGREVDLMIVRNGQVSLVECKSNVDYTAADVKTFAQLEKYGLSVGPSCVMCLCDVPYPVREGVIAVPISSI